MQEIACPTKKTLIGKRLGEVALLACKGTLHFSYIYCLIVFTPIILPMIAERIYPR